MVFEKALLHAYIVSAPPAPGYEMAREIAAAQLCLSPGGKPCGVCRHCMKVKKGTHPDVIVLERQTDDKGRPRREIYVDQIRALADSCAILPNEAEKKVYIIRDAGAMNLNAQNALLKLLEEPPSFDAFVLVADSAEQLLETVRSRCAVLSVNAPMPGAEAQMRAKAERYLELACAGDAASLLSYTNKLAEMNGQDAQSFADACTELLTDMLCARLSAAGLTHRDMMRLVRLMERAKEYLRCNVGVKHVFGMLAVDTIELK